MSIIDKITQDKVSDLDSHPVLKIEPDRTVRDAMALLQKAGRGCILICQDDQLMGIFTERDVLIRVHGEKQNVDQPITELMTSNPATIQTDDTVASVIKMMRKGGYRHIPVVNKEKKPVSILSVKHLVQYLVDYYPQAVYNLPPDPDKKQVSREGA